MISNDALLLIKLRPTLCVSPSFYCSVVAIVNLLLSLSSHCFCKVSFCEYMPGKRHMQCIHLVGKAKSFDKHDAMSFWDGG